MYCIQGLFIFRLASNDEHEHEPLQDSDPKNRLEGMYIKNLKVGVCGGVSRCLLL